MNCKVGRPASSQTDVHHRETHERRVQRWFNKERICPTEEVINDMLRERYGRLFVELKVVGFPTDCDTDLVHTSVRLRRNSGTRKYRNRIRRIVCSYRHRL